MFSPEAGATAAQRHGSDRDRWRRRLAIACAAVAFGTGLAALVLIALSWGTALPETYGFRGKTVLSGFTACVVGLAIVLRWPRNSVAWLFLGAAISGGLYELADVYQDYALVVRGGTIPGGIFAAWLVSFIWVPTTTLAPLVLPLVFPDGRLPSPRWRVAAWYVLATIAFTMAGFALAPELVAGSPNPFSPFPAGAFASADVQRMAALPLALLISIAALVTRFRSSQGVLRLQMKWILYAAVMTALVLAPVAVLEAYRPYQVVNVLVLNAIPVAAGVAILRYRLYDIDLIIRRTLVYGLTTTAIGVAFFGAVLVLESSLASFTGGGQIAVAGSTLLAFALFQPVRTRVQGIVDRRFYRTRNDAVRTLDTFAVRVATEVDLDQVAADLLDTVARALAPEHAGLWLRPVRGGARASARPGRVPLG